MVKNDYKKDVEKLIEGKTELIKELNGDFSTDDINKTPITVAFNDNYTKVRLSVYQMPKTPQDWKGLNEYMIKLFGLNPKEIREICEHGLERERERARLKKNPNCLLFALETREEK